METAANNQIRREPPFKILRIKRQGRTSDLNRKDRARILRKTGYAGQERYYKSSIFSFQFSIRNLAAAGHRADEIDYQLRAG